ncbi:Flp family type IVb pilin [Sinisalibacter aestuarii]|nr:hypothetical protein [Sinisalibacter aestuarii]
MKTTLKSFLRNESGAISLDWTVLVAALVGVSLVVAAEAWRGLDKVTAGYDDFDQPTGLMTVLVNIDAGGGPGTPAAANPSPETGGTETGGSETGESGDEGSSGGSGNPGNDKDVGNAGENPNGKGGWGSGNRGRSR